MSLNATGRPRSGCDGQARLFGGAARGVEIERDESADLRLARGDRLGAKLDHRAGFEFAGLDAAGKIERREHQLCPIGANSFVLSSVIPAPAALSRCGLKAAPGSRGDDHG